MIPGDEPIVLLEVRKRGQVCRLIFSNGVEVATTVSAADKYHLAPEQGFLESAFIELKKVLDERYAYYLAEGLMARRAHSVGEFKSKLRRKNIEAGLIGGIIGDFLRRGLLDDEAYARARAEFMLRRKPGGKGHLVADLQKKLIRRELAEETVRELLSDTDEVGLAIDLLEKKRGSFEKFDLETARRKAYNYLSRRSISYPAAREAWERVFQEWAFKRGE